LFFTTKEALMGQPVVHFEIIGTEPGKLRDYYRELFGWEFTTGGPVAAPISEAGNYGFTEGQTIPGGVGGGSGYEPHVIFYVGVPDVEAAVARAERLGGTRVLGPVRSPGTDLVVAQVNRRRIAGSPVRRKPSEAYNPSPSGEDRRSIRVTPRHRYQSSSATMQARAYPRRRARGSVATLNTYPVVPLGLSGLASRCSILPTAQAARPPGRSGSSTTNAVSRRSGSASRARRKPDAVACHGPGSGGPGAMDASITPRNRTSSSASS
jgi:uncharacterized protein